MPILDIGYSLLPLVLGIAVMAGVGHVSYVLAAKEFFANDSARVWIGINTLQPAVWIVIIAANWRTIRVWEPGFLPHMILILALCCLVPLIPRLHPTPGRLGLDAMGDLLNFMYAYVFVGSLLAAALAGSIGACSVRLLSLKETSVTALLEIRKPLQAALSGLTTIIIVIVFAEFWLRRSLATLGGQTYSGGDVVAYGLFFSALLAVAYGPAFARYTKLSNELIEKLVPLDVPGTRESNLKGLEERQKLEAALGVGGADSVRTLVTTLGPTIAAVLSIATGKIGAA